MISKEKVQHVAKLARLGLKGKEIEKMQKELSSILDYIKLLEEVDIAGVRPTFHSVPLKNIIREDRTDEENPKTVKELRDASPAKQGDYIKVKGIL